MMTMDKLIHLYYKHKDGEITEEQLIQQLLMLVIESSETYDSWGPPFEEEVISFKKMVSLTDSRYLLDARLNNCTIKGTIDIVYEYR